MNEQFTHITRDGLWHARILHTLKDVDFLYPVVALLENINTGKDMLNQYTLELCASVHGPRDLDIFPISDKTVLTNPYTGQPRDYRDVESDPEGVLMVAPAQPLQAVPQATLALDYREVDTIRQWYNCIHDVNYSYLVAFDHRLMDRVCKYIKSLHKGVDESPRPNIEPKPVGELVDVQYKCYKKFDDGETSFTWMTDSDLIAMYGWRKCEPEESRNLYTAPPSIDALIAELETWYSTVQTLETPKFHTILDKYRGEK